MINNICERFDEGSKVESSDQTEYFDESGYNIWLETVSKEKEISKLEQQKQANELVEILKEQDGQANESGEILTKQKKQDKIVEYMQWNGVEPIENVHDVIWFSDFCAKLLKDAKEQWRKRVVESIEHNDAKNQDIYDLPKYKELVQKWFILPSDIRTYYDSANKEPVYHLWVDYQVKSGTPVKSIASWKVIYARLDWWLWHRVVLEHKTEDWMVFYSLYGHLWSMGLPKEGEEVLKWQQIWCVWKAFSKENWNREEHLHFQIMEHVDSPRGYSKVEWEWNYDVLKCLGKIDNKNM